MPSLVKLHIWVAGGRVYLRNLRGGGQGQKPVRGGDRRGRMSDLYDEAMLRSRSRTFAFAGGFLLLAAAVVTGLTLRFIHRASVADGVATVAAYENTSASTHPHISFTTRLGIETRFTSHGVLGGKRNGEHVRVLYEEGCDPQWFRDGVYAELDDWGALWLFPLAFFVFGVALLVTGPFASAIGLKADALLRRYRGVE